MSTARTGSGRGRPVRWASAASMTAALPERSVSSAAKATVWSLTPPPRGRQGQAIAGHHGVSARQRARRAPLEEPMPRT